MDCITCKNLIHDYLDGVLPQGREEAIFEHIEICPGCEKYYEDMIEIFDRISEPEVNVPYGFSAAWRGKVAEASGRKRRVSLRTLVPALAACACGVLVMSVVFLSPGTFGNKNQNLGSSVYSAQHSIEGEADAGNTQADAQSDDSDMTPVIMADAQGDAGTGAEQGGLAPDNSGEAEAFNADTDADAGRMETDVYESMLPGEEDVYADGMDDSFPQQFMPEIGRADIPLVHADDSVTKAEVREYIFEKHKDETKVTDTEKGLLIMADHMILEDIMDRFRFAAPVDDIMDAIEIVFAPLDDGSVEIPPNDFDEMPVD